MSEKKSGAWARMQGSNESSRIRQTERQCEKKPYSTVAAGDGDDEGRGRRKEKKDSQDTEHRTTGVLE